MQSLGTPPYSEQQRCSLLSLDYGDLLIYKWSRNLIPGPLTRCFAPLLPGAAAWWGRIRCIKAAGTFRLQGRARAKISIKDGGEALASNRQISGSQPKAGERVGGRGGGGQRTGQPALHDQAPQRWQDVEPKKAHFAQILTSDFQTGLMAGPASPKQTRLSPLPSTLAHISRV